MFKVLRRILRKRLSGGFYNQFMLGLFFVSLLVALFFTLIHPKLDSDSVYLVSAVAEQITTKLDKSHRTRWYLNNVTLKYPCPIPETDICVYDEYGAGQITRSDFTGSVEVISPAQAVFTRIGGSKMIIRVQRPCVVSAEIDPVVDCDVVSTNLHNTNDNRDIAVFYDSNEEFVEALTEKFTITIDNIPARLESGESIFFNVSGEVYLADTLRYPDSSVYPVLYSGEIHILEESILGSENYLIGPFALLPGDSIHVSNRTTSDVGFIKANNDAGLITTYTVTATKSEISRFKFDGYEISASIWNRLTHDQVLGYLWMFTALVFPLLQVEAPNDDEKKTKPKKRKTK